MNRLAVSFSLFSRYIVTICLIWGVSAQALTILPANQIVEKNEELLFVGTEVFLRSKEALKIHIPQGLIHIKSGFGFLQKQNDSLVIQNLHGEIFFVEARTKKITEVLPITQIKIYPDGQVSVMKSLDYKQHLLSFQKYFQPTRAQMRSYAEILGKRVRKSREIVSEHYSQLFQRSIASAQDQDLKRVLQKKVKLSERQRLRKIYEQKVFGINLDKDLSSEE